MEDDEDGAPTVVDTEHIPEDVRKAIAEHKDDSQSRRQSESIKRLRDLSDEELKPKKKTSRGHKGKKGSLRLKGMSLKGKGKEAYFPRHYSCSSCL